MNLGRCSKGHFYDKERFSNCPHCMGIVPRPFTPEESGQRGFDESVNVPVIPAGTENREIDLSEKEDIVLESKLVKVALYPDSAKLTHEVRYKTRKKHEKIFIVDFPSELQCDNVHIKAEKGLVCSAISKFSWKKTDKNSELADDEKRMGQLMNQYQFLLKKQKGLIRYLGQCSKRVTTIEELQLNYRQAEEMNLKLLEKQQELEEEITKLYKKVAEESEKSDRVLHGIELDVCAEEGTEYVILIEYETEKAYWKPAYDVQSFIGSKRVSFILKAKIYQNTGVDWNGVKLLFSTGTKNNVHITELEPYKIVKKSSEIKTGFGTLPFPGAAPFMNHSGDVEDYTLSVYDEEGETETREYGARTQFMENVESGTDHKDYSSSVKREFIMEGTYTICRGAQTMLVIHRIDKEVKKIFFAIPEKDSSEYMGIHVQELKEMKLLSCTANIFLDGAYIGSKSINSEKLDGLFVLGQAKGVTVSKKSVKKKSDPLIAKMMAVGVIRREYRIKVKNELATEAVLRIIDQIPITEEEDVKLEDVKLGDACLDENTGYCYWNVSLKPGEERVIPMEYTICLPSEGEYEY